MQEARLRDAKLRQLVIFALNEVDKMNDPCPVVGASATMVIESHLKKILGVLSDEN